MTIQEDISNWLKKYLLKNKLKSFIVGVSGGIDSAVVSTLCAMTGIKTIVVIMPIHQNQDETNRGLEHCSWLSKKYKNVEILNMDLSTIYNEFISIIPNKYNSQLAYANTRARIRMSTLYLIAGNSNGIVVGTGNKVEDFGVGFFTKYGDGGVDISPIADLTKSEVKSIAKELKVSQEIIMADPTDGLWDDNRNDEEQLGLSYDEIENAMIDVNCINRKKYLDIRNNNIHKMNSIPVCIIDEKIKSN